MIDKMFVTIIGLQKAEIEQHCFGSCKKTIFGMIMDEEYGGLSHCFEANCPFLDMKGTRRKPRRLERQWTRWVS
jgi:hypothetical protein